MKKFITLLFAATILFSCGEAQEKPMTEEENVEEEVIAEPVQVVDGYTHFGAEPVDMDAALSMEDFATAFSNGVTANYTVKAELASICAKAGCFVIVTMPDSTDVRVMFKDHFTIPTDTEIGTEAFFTGEARMDTTSVADLQHYIMDEMEDENIAADKKAELQAKHDAVTEPVFEPIFIATGILVKD